MASTSDYLEFVLEQLRKFEGITYIKMMGEYLLYYKGKIFGGIYDNRFLVKDVPSARSLMPHAKLVPPYNNGTPMLPVSDIDDADFLYKLVKAMYAELNLSTKGKKT